MFFQASSTINSFACPKHPKEELNNFCNNAECLLPLCSLCTVEHFELHYKQGTRPDLRNFKSIQLECANRIKSLSESLQLAVKEVKDSYQSLPEILKNDIDKIRQSKEDLNSFINEFYDCQLRGVNSPLKYFEDKLKNIQEEVNGLDRKLCGDGFNEVVKCLQKRNFEQEINQAKGEYTSEVQKIGAESNKKHRKVRVQVDNSILSHIKDKLNEYVHVSKKTPSKTSSENSSIQGKVREGSEVTSASKEIEIDRYAQPSPPTRSQTINLISTAECSLNHNDIQPVLSSTSSDKNKDSFSTPTHEPYKINEQSTAASKDISKISYSGFTNGKGYKNSPNTSQFSMIGNGKHTLEKSFGEKGNMSGNNKESVRDVKSVLGMLGMFQKRKTEIENNKPIQAIEIAKSENPSKFQSFQERYQQIQNKVKRNPLAEIQNSEPDITKRVKVDQNELEKFKPKPRSSFHELFIRSKTEMFENGQSNSFGSNIFDSVNLPEKRSERKDNFSPISENLYRRSASLLSKDGIIIDDNDMKQKEGSVAVSSPYHFSQCDPESQDLSGTSHYYDIEPLNTLNGKNSVAISEHISQVMFYF